MVKRRAQLRDQAVAYHEAGHAIASWRILHRINEVTIEPSAESAGSAKQGRVFTSGEIAESVEYDNSARVQRKLENLALVALAGSAAQRKHSPRSVRRYHWRADRQDAADCLSQLTGNSEQLEAYLHLVHIRARNFVEVNWKGIKTLAEELLRVRTLRGRALHDFIRHRCFGFTPVHRAKDEH